MTTLADAIERINSRKRGKGRLGEAATRTTLPVAVSEAVPTASTEGDGIISPLVEQEYAGATFYSLTSSDGLFVLEYGDTTTLIDNDGTGNTFVIKHDDPST